MTATLGQARASVERTSLSDYLTVSCTACGAWRGEPCRAYPLDLQARSFVDRAHTHHDTSVHCTRAVEFAAALQGPVCPTCAWGWSGCLSGWHLDR